MRFPGREIFACRLQDLPWWIAAELWEVELEAPVRALETQVAAAAGRLVRQVTALGCAHARGPTARPVPSGRAISPSEALGRDGRAEEAQALARTAQHARAGRVARALAGDARARLSSNLAGYVAESSIRASEGAAAAAANIAANAAVLALGDPSAFAASASGRRAGSPSTPGPRPVPVAAV